MRRIPRRSVLGTLLVCLTLLTLGIRYTLAQRPTSVTVTRIYTGNDGQSHAEDLEINLTPSQIVDGAVQSNTKASNLRFLRCPPGWVNDFHNAGAFGRQYVLTLSGRGEIELSSGQKIALTPGRVILAEDLTGKGHLTRTVGSEDWLSVHVFLAE